LNYIFEFCGGYPWCPPSGVAAACVRREPGGRSGPIDPGRARMTRYALARLGSFARDPARPDRDRVRVAALHPGRPRTGQARRQRAARGRRGRGVNVSVTTIRCRCSSVTTSRGSSRATSATRCAPQRPVESDLRAFLPVVARAGLVHRPARSRLGSAAGHRDRPSPKVGRGFVRVAMQIGASAPAYLVACCWCSSCS